jgi:Phage major capsid protein E
MADAIKSIFGAYADKLQLMVNEAADKFAPTFFDKYFDWGIPTKELTFVTAIGATRVAAAASIVDRDGLSPLRSRPGLSKLNGEVPAIKHKFSWSESEVRSYLSLESLPLSDEAKKQQLLNLMFGDTKKAGDGLMKRIDFMVLEGLSTGSITVTIDNNPDGIVAPEPIDLLMPDGNKTNAAVSWATAATATPIADITTIVEARADEGRSISKILMTRAAFILAMKTTEVAGLVGGFLRLAASAKIQPTQGQMNEYLVANGLPEIELVPNSGKINIEKDGIISAVAAWETTNVVFLPDGKLGLIHNAIPIEKMRPVKNVTYADFNHGIISKWSQNEPYSEWTKGEVNAFPGFEAIDGISILSHTRGF